MSDPSAAAIAPILHGPNIAELLEPFALTAVVVTSILLGAIYVGARAVVRRYSSH